MAELGPVVRKCEPGEPAAAVPDVAAIQGCVSLRCWCPLWPRTCHAVHANISNRVPLLVRP